MAGSSGENDGVLCEALQTEQILFVALYDFNSVYVLCLHEYWDISWNETLSHQYVTIIFNTLLNQNHYWIFTMVLKGPVEPGFDIANR